MKVDKTKWITKPISSLFDLQMGKTPSRKSPELWGNGNTPWVSISDMNGIKYISSTKEMLPFATIIQCNIPIIPAGIVIMSFKLTIGKTCITNVPLTTNEAIMAFYPKKEVQIDNSFLCYALSAIKWKGNRAVKGLTINKKTISQKEMSLPPLSEQQAIASELDAIQTMIDGYKAQLEDLDALAQSIFLDMFDDPVSNPKGWKIKKLEDISEIISGFAFPSGDFSDTNPVKAIKITNVGVGKFIFDNSSLPLRYKETDAFSAHFGDIALALTRTVISSGLKRAIVPEDYEGSLINQRVAVIRGTLVNQSILYHYLGTEYVKFYVQKHAAALMQPNLSINDLRQLPIFVPHLTLQQQFSQQVEAIDEQKKRIRFQLQDAETLMAERMQYYFS